MGAARTNTVNRKRIAATAGKPVLRGRHGGRRLAWVFASLCLAAGSAAAGSQPQTISVDGAPRVYIGTTATLSANASSGLPVAFSSATPAVCSVVGWVITGLGAGACTVYADQAGDASYAAASRVSLNIAVTPAPQRINFFSAPALAVGGSGTLTATASSGLPLSFSSLTPAVCSVAGNTLNGLATGTCTVAADQAGNASFAAAARSSISVAVGLTTQTIRFGAAPALRVGASGTVAAVASSGLPVSFASLTPATCSVAGNAVTALAAGLCTVAASQPGDGSHAAAPQATQDIAVSAAGRGAQTIAFGTPAGLAPGSSATLTASASSGLPVSFRSLTPEVCVVAGQTVTPLAGGTCTIAASQTGNGAYAAAAEALQSVTVGSFSLDPGNNRAAVALAGNMFSDHALILLANGRVSAFGNNDMGQLGDGTTTDHTTDPVTVLNLSGVIALASGLRHSLAVKADGSVWAWGANFAGQLGDGTLLTRTAPVRVVSLANVSALAAGAYHSLALKADGSVWAWGDYAAALGGSAASAAADPSLPTQVPGLGQVIAIAAGPNYSLALKADGSVWAWGRCKAICAATGALQQVAGPGYTAISAGNNYFLALKADGTVWAQGMNNGGQLGDGSFTDHRDSAVQVLGLPLPATAIAASQNRGRAILNDGTVWRWGGADLQAIREAGQTPPATPPAPDKLAYITGAVAVAAGGVTGATVSDGFWTLVLMPDGGIVAYEDDLFGNYGLQYGYPGVVNTVSVESSAAVSAEGQALTLTASLRNASGTVPTGTITFKDGDVVLGSASLNHGVAQLTLTGLTAGTHAIVATYDGNWQNAAVSSSPAYQVVTSPGAATGTPPLVAVAANARGSHALGLRADGAVLAWGANGHGQLGDGSHTDRMAGVVVTALGGVAAIASGAAHSLALKADGTVWAWGDGTRGALGNGSTIDQPRPAWLPSLPAIGAIAAGAAHSLALAADGSVRAFGANDAGQLGNGSTSDGATPATVGGLSAITAIAAGERFSMALKADGSVWTWGDNGAGQLGRAGDALLPAPIVGLDPVVAIAAGADFALAIKADGSVHAWGNNAAGQLGDGTWVSRAAPAPVVGLPAAASALTAGNSHAMALLADGSVWAWGDNSAGQLGNGGLADTGVPAAVPLATGVTAIAAGDRFSLAVKSDGSLLAWGLNAYGELASGASTSLETVPVSGALGVTAVQLSSSAQVAVVGQPLTLTATLSGVAGRVPTGSVQFQAGGTTIGSATAVNGVARFTTAALAAGSHAISASYDGDGANEAATSNTIVIAVGVPAATVTLTPSATSVAAGTPVVLAISVSGAAPTGSVSLMDGNSSLGSYALAAGQASLIMTLPAGSHSLAASYAGDAHNAPAVSVARTVVVAPDGATITVNLVPGWNLLGNGAGGPIDVAAVFGDADKVATVWKWLPGPHSGWAFYTPQLSDGGAGYAAGKGYAPLTTVNGGEGFWVNARTAFPLTLAAGNPVTAAYFRDSAGGANGLQSGWNLIAIGDAITPRAFANAIATTVPAAGFPAANSLLSLWAWFPGGGSRPAGWLFYAPLLDNTGTLTNYIHAKGYLDFTTQGRTLDAATGFWVNHP